MRTITTVCSAAVLAALLVAPTNARADDWNQLTYFTFSGPFEIPGHTLAAGTYTFKIADGATDRHIVQVFDKQTSKLIATIMTLPDERLKPASKPIVMFKETAAGNAPAVQAWFYPGNTIGNEFIYPRRQAMRIAKATHTPVLAMADNTDEADMKSAPVSHIDENGNPSDDMNPAATATPDTMASPDMTAAPPATTPAAPVYHRAELPQTASPLGLYELMSAASLAGAFGIRRFRSR